MEKSVGVNIAFDRLAVLYLQNIIILLSYLKNCYKTVNTLPSENKYKIWSFNNEGSTVFF